MQNSNNENSRSSRILNSILSSQDLRNADKIPAKIAAELVTAQLSPKIPELNLRKKNVRKYVAEESKSERINRDKEKDPASLPLLGLSSIVAQTKNIVRFDNLVMFQQFFFFHSFFLKKSLILF